MKKILVVEDNRVVALDIVAHLKASGYTTLAAFDAVSGLSTAVKERPNLIILDISMPAGGGFMVAERVNALPALIGTPIIFLTGSDRSADRKRAAEVSAAAFLEKPYDSAALLTAVRSALGESAS
jgi:CheY-like chemotaxis protein